MSDHLPLWVELKIDFSDRVPEEADHVTSSRTETLDVLVHADRALPLLALRSAQPPDHGAARARVLGRHCQSATLHHVPARSLIEEWILL